MYHNEYDPKQQPRAAHLGRGPVLFPRFFVSPPKFSLLTSASFVVLDLVFNQWNITSLALILLFSPVTEAQMFETTGNTWFFIIFCSSYFL